jgi:valyl-tRNA synthetase
MAENEIQEIEKKWKEYWQKEKIYEFKNNSKKRTYAIDTPPPTVSGKMHIGHACSYSQQDFIARYRRMSGLNVFYPFGTDDNGLPTEKLIQKLKNIKSKDFSRKEFIKICLDTLKEITPEFIEDWKNLGISADYNLSYSTIDKNSQKISQKSFIELYKKGLIYKKEFPTIWDTEFQTPVAQAELEDKEKKTFFTTIKFTSQNKILPIATTRPELLGACVAIFVNPKDKRYKEFIGKKAKIPIFNFEVPIIADESAEIEKGTGVLMICSYGDKYDVDAISKHKLNPKVIINKDGTLNIKPYTGMFVKDARKKILEELKENNLIIEQKEITHIVNVFEKSGREIEFIPTEQWFIKILENKKQLIEQGRKIKWYPEHMQKRYENWINGLEWDWSVSRERHFGIPIPVWYCEKCKEVVLPDKNELPIDPVETDKECKKCKSRLIPETKVLDTWATSSLTPEIASSLNPNIKIPFSLRPQAHDIIRTWAFYTIVKALYEKNEIPWKNISISGFVTMFGEKMSKSKGNVIAPQEIIEKYSRDSLRYWAASSKLGEDLDYQEKELVTGIKFTKKILNATKFIFMNLEHQKNCSNLQETDRLFLMELNKLIENATKSFEEYNYSKAKIETENFFWKLFTDNYLEIIKNRVYNGTKSEKESAFYTLYQTLFTLLKLFAPITPYITEEIYQEHFKKYEKDKSIHLSNWPTKIKISEKKNDETIWLNLIETISRIRQQKSEFKKSVKAEIILTLPKEILNSLNPVLNDLKSVTNSKEIKEGKFNVEFV